MSDVQDQVPRALALAKAGDIAGAIAAGEADLAARPGDAGLAMFVGVLCCRQGDLARGIAHLRRSVELAPNESAAKVELGRALLSSGASEEAEALAAPLAAIETPIGREMSRIRGQALLRVGRADEAAEAFSALTRADGADFESWDGLAASRIVLNDPPGAIEAGLRATGLRPTAITYWINLARAHVAAKDYPAAIEAAGNAVMRDPNNAAARLELGRALAGDRKTGEALASLVIAERLAPDSPDMLSEIADVAFTCKAFDRAETLFERALAIKPRLEQALLGLGRTYERTNRNRALLDLFDAPENAWIPPERTALLRARALRGDGRLDEAWVAIEDAPVDVDRASRAQLIGDIADRRGDTAAAFAAFTEANAHLAASASDSAVRAAEYRDQFDRMRSVITPEWYADWTPQPAAIDGRRPPLFIFGFPRSGTTLIDTMLSGHPDAIVLEEEPVIDRVAEGFGSIKRLADLSLREIATLRARYFAEVAKVEPDTAGKLIVDKHPLALGSTPILHRIFPDARFVFVERHPCDVVLSCFITSAVMDANVANFFDVFGTARLYDSVFAYWHRCREVLPIHVATVRYERLIADPETELRQLAGFAGLEWTPRLLAHQDSAAARGSIGSPSYTQVAEPLYTRATGRWLRYREAMAPVIPILQPWIDRLGYSLD